MALTKGANWRWGEVKGKKLFNSGEGQTLHSICFHCLFPSLSLCLMNLSSTTAPDNTSCFFPPFRFLFLPWHIFSALSALLSRRHCVFPPGTNAPSGFIPLLFTADPFSPQRTPSGWDIELGELPRGFWQPRSPSPPRPAEIKDKNITLWTPLCTRSSGYLMSTTLKSTGLVLRGPPM